MIGLPITLVYFSLVCSRHCHGLVGPCTVVAQAQCLADAHPIHPRPVRGTGRCSVTLHPHAQDPESAAARPALFRLPGRFLHQDL